MRLDIYGLEATRGKSSQLFMLMHISYKNASIELDLLKLWSHDTEQGRLYHYEQEACL